MKTNFSWLTPSEAAKLLGCSTRYVQKSIKSGKLSATTESGKYYIDRSEFFRVFPDAHKDEQARNNSRNTNESERLKVEVDMLKQMNSQKDREIDFLRDQVQSISHEKIKMLDALTSTTRLLEHKKDKEEEKPRRWRGIFTAKKD